MKWSACQAIMKPLVQIPILQKKKKKKKKKKESWQPSLPQKSDDQHL
jgi:hypothetical protein